MIILLVRRQNKICIWKDVYLHLVIMMETQQLLMGVISIFNIWSWRRCNITNNLLWYSTSTKINNKLTKDLNILRTHINKKKNFTVFDFHRKCGLSHRKPWNVKWKKEKEKKNKRPNNQRQDLPILSFPIHSSHYYWYFKLSETHRKQF